MPLLSPSLYQFVRGYEGQVANIQDYRHIGGTQETFVNGSTEFLPFGRVVVRNAADPSCLELPSAPGQEALGVAILNDRFMAFQDDPRSTGYPPNQVTPILRKGVIYMVAETALTRGGALFFRHTENAVPSANEALGRVRADADGGNAEAFAAGTFRVTEDVLAGEIVAILFDLDITL